MIIPLTFSAMMGLVLTSCSSGTGSKDNNVVAANIEQTGTEQKKTMNEGDGIYANIKTNKGTIKIKLEQTQEVVVGGSRPGKGGR